MKQLLFFLMLFCATSAVAQDVIVKKDGGTIVCRIVEVNSSEIVYKKWSDLNGANYVMDRSVASAINYETGKKDSLSAGVENKYAPGVQNDGARALNDKALLDLDFAENDYRKEIKRWKSKKILAWSCGGLTCAMGLVVLGSSFESASTDGMTAACVLCGTALLAGGVTWIYCVDKKANKKIQEANTRVKNFTLLHNEFELNDGSKLSAGLDILRSDKTKSVGIGFHYNF